MNEGNSIRLEEFHQLTKQIRGSEQHLIVPLSSLDPERCQKERGGLLLTKLSRVYRLLPKSLFSSSKTFIEKSKARSRRCQNSPLGLKQLTSLIFHFAKGFLAKNVLMTDQRDYGLGNSLCRSDPVFLPPVISGESIPRR
jgi:hypothetical protein